MADKAVTKPAGKQGKAPTPKSGAEAWWPFSSLRQEVDRLFDDFGRDFWRTPLGRTRFSLGPLWSGAAMPVVDVVDSENAYEITAELPGMDEKEVEIKLADGRLTIKGEKQEEKEEKKKNYYLHERHFGSFERSFDVPDSVDTDKIEATFRKGLLTVTLPKKPGAQKPAKKINVKAA